MEPSKFDFDKRLSSGPLTKQGFTDEIRKGIEERISRKGRFPFSWAPFAGMALFAVALVFVVRFNAGTGEEMAAEAFHSPFFSASAGDRQFAAAAGQATPVRIDSALLLGLRTDYSYAASTYRTLLIAPEDGALTVAAEGPGVLVPHGQVFWKIDSLAVASDASVLQFNAARPADAPAETPQPALISGEVKQYGEKLLFVGNRDAAMEQSIELTAAPSASQKRFRVKKLEDLVPPAAELWQERSSSGGGETLADAWGGPVPAAVSADGAPIDWETTDWTLHRNQGKWTAEVSESAADKGSGSLRELALQLPEALVSFDTLGCSWEQIKQAEPEAVDAVASPTGEWLMIVTDKALEAYAYRDGAIGPLLLRVELHDRERMIMDQWATGSYVSDWIYRSGEYLGKQ